MSVAAQIQVWLQCMWEIVSKAGKQATRNPRHLAQDEGGRWRKEQHDVADLRIILIHDLIVEWRFVLGAQYFDQNCVVG